MAHAHHFLERLDRVTREQTEFALELYRDHEAVAYVLQHVNLPPGGGRVALAVDDPREGPFVVVTRDGRFVTCLGRGMRHDLPVVPRAQLDALLGKVAEKRVRRELAQRELRPDEEEENFFQRIVSRGRRFAREDFVAVSSFEATLGIQPYLVMLELVIDVVGTRAAMVHGANKVVIKGSSRPAFEQQDRLEWAVAHLMLLSGAADRRELDQILATTKEGKISPTFACSVQAGSTFFFRAAWAAARLGKGVLPIYKTVFASAEDWMAMLDAGLGLGALALRHSGLTAEVRRTLQGYAPPPEGNEANPVAATRAAIAKAVLETIEDADERTATVLKIGRDMAVSAGGHLPEGHALRFDKPEDVPEELARTEILSVDADVHESAIQTLLFAALPLAARAAAEDFYHPREIVRARYGQWTPEETLERLKRFARAAPKKEAVRAEPRPGRNEPCPCGSGKKWKKCHGA